jgi:isopentenyl-diphosphate Delta-isomerase
MAQAGDGRYGRKLRHVEVCRTMAVQYTTRTTGFELVDLPYCAVPETDLDRIDTSTTFLGKQLRAPFLIGAMTGGTELSGRINRNLAFAAEHLGVGLMLGSQRIMLDDPAAVDSFIVRRYAPRALLIGNLGAAQLNQGRGASDVLRAIQLTQADAFAVHTNPLQEAMQQRGDHDFTDLVPKLAALTAAVPHPVLLNEVGHGLSAEVARRVGGIGLAALDVAGAGGTSWAKVEEFVNHGEIRDLELAEWGIPTATSLRTVVAAVPHLPLVASGGIRTGLDAAKALAMGASVVAVALPLLPLAIESTDAVVEWIERFVDRLRIAMHCSGVRDLAGLRRLELVPRPSRSTGTAQPQSSSPPGSSSTT